MRFIGYAIALVAIIGAVDLAKAQGEGDSNIEPVDATIGKYKDNATLQCNVEGVDSYKPMEWWFDGKQILPTDEEDKYTIDANNNTLTIQGVLPEHVGEYVCKVDLYNGQSFNATVTLKAAPHVYSFEKSKNLVQGDPLVLVCEVAGYPEPTLAWYKDDEPLKASDPRVSLTPNKQGVENGTLRLEDLTYDDRAEYTCVATNEIGTHNSTILVRVKDKLAALWPFLGICAEVAILVIIIFVYENRRSKKLEELDAREEADHLTNSHSHKGGDEVRQRK